MNESICELAEESGITQYVAAHNKYLERFAELIIRECAMFLDENSELDQCNNNVWFPDSDELLKHFGIEKMNENIKDICLKALHQCDPADPTFFEKYSDLFAQLIIKECLETIEESNLKLIKRDVDGIYYAVKRHFGVK